jgi:hypothetical protein
VAETVTKLQHPNTCGLILFLVASPLSHAPQTKALVKKQMAPIEVPMLEIFDISFGLLSFSLQHMILYPIQ